MPRLISTERGQGLNGRWLRLVGPSLSTITIEPADLPEDVLAFLYRLLDLGGTYGDPDAGDPIQHDEPRIEHDQGEVEIVVYNRAILLFMTDSGAVKRIHEVCCRLEDLAPR